MIGVVVAAHGELAHALVATARLVVSDPGPVLAVGIDAQDDSASYQARLQAAVRQVQQEPGGTLVLTDMFGGTPANVGLTLHEPGKVEVLTGANLSMLIKALQLGRGDMDLATAALRVRESGVRAISIASEVLSGGPAATGERRP